MIGVGSYTERRASVTLKDAQSKVIVTHLDWAMD